ncbi:glutathione S-transferase family protein [Jannaschia sp. W003]|uniref:glutathione S-transferase family protein n=1 Tax=Jannaschia sp. W003 TaxID=2867012 RepID=UPI0021A6C6E5|nr:glutathione S-transferase [Jannaschia sp. W003]UWQ20684.1 glutathione S-transferase [Jannaschia sp. W003]
MLTLHLARGTVALAAHMALEEAALPHRLAWVDFAAAAQRGPAFLALNPKGRVPVLETPEGALTETPAILEHVAALAPEAALMPDGAWPRARVRETMAWLASTVHVAHAHRMRGHRWSDDPAAHASMQAKVPETMGAAAAEAEERLGECPWLHGAFSVADLHLYAIARWLPGDGVDLARFPRLAAHGRAVAARPAAARALAHHGAA